MRPIIAALGAVFMLVSPAAANVNNFQTQSGKVLCAVTPNSSIDSIGPNAVVCQGLFDQAPAGYNGAVTTGNGEFH